VQQAAVVTTLLLDLLCVTLGMQGKAEIVERLGVVLGEAGMSDLLVLPKVRMGNVFFPSGCVAAGHVLPCRPHCEGMNCALLQCM
jgi:hypothetical protein